MIVDCAVYKHGRRQAGEISIAEASHACRQDGSFVWLGLYEPVRRGVRRRSSGSSACTRSPSRTRSTRTSARSSRSYDETLLVVLKPVRYIDHDEVVEIGEIALFVNPEFLISVRHGEPSPLKEVRARLEHEPGAGRAGAGRGPLRDRRPDRGRLRAGGRGPHGRHPGGRGAGVLARTATTRRSGSTTSSARCSTSTARWRRWHLRSSAWRRDPSTWSTASCGRTSATCTTTCCA